MRDPGAAIPTFGTVRVSLSGEILEIDDGFAELLGVPAREAVGRFVSDFTDEPHGASPQMMIAILVRTGEPMSVRRIFIRPDRSRLACTVQICLLRNAAGEPDSVIAIGQAHAGP